MNNHLQLTVIVMYIFHFQRAEGSRKAMTCLDNQDNSKNLLLSVVSKRNETSDWNTSFTSIYEIDNCSLVNNISVDVSHSVTECEGKTRIRITGSLRESVKNMGRGNVLESSSIEFDPKCGSNVAVINNRRTVQKINLELALQSVVFTNRPLKDDEIFEVQLNKKHDKFTHSLGIGASTHSPKEIEIADHINHFPPPTWAMYHGNTYQNGSLSVRNYGRDLNALVAGDRVGVMRSSTGNIHFFVNGADQGPAASNVPYPVYGMLELWHNAAMATIVNSS